jgi:hypothetical protein
MLYVAGGRGDAGLATAVYAVDTADGSVRTIAQLPAGVEQALLLPSDGSLYLLGGRGESGAPLATIEQIDPTSGVVHAAGRLPAPLAEASALQIGAETYVVASGAGLVYRLR